MGCWVAISPALTRIWNAIPWQEMADTAWKILVGMWDMFVGWWNDNGMTTKITTVLVSAFNSAFEAVESALIKRFGPNWFTGMMGTAILALGNIWSVVADMWEASGAQARMDSFIDEIIESMMYLMVKIAAFAIGSLGVMTLNPVLVLAGIAGWFGADWLKDVELGSSAEEAITTFEDLDQTITNTGNGWGYFADEGEAALENITTGVENLNTTVNDGSNVLQIYGQYMADMGYVIDETTESTRNFGVEGQASYIAVIQETDNMRYAVVDADSATETLTGTVETFGTAAMIANDAAAEAAYITQIAQKDLTTAINDSRDAYEQLALAMELPIPIPPIPEPPEAPGWGGANDTSIEDILAEFNNFAGMDDFTIGEILTSRGFNSNEQYKIFQLIKEVVEEAASAANVLRAEAEDALIAVSSIEELLGKLGVNLADNGSLSIDMGGTTVSGIAKILDLETGEAITALDEFIKYAEEQGKGVGVDGIAGELLFGKWDQLADAYGFVIDEGLAAAQALIASEAAALEALEAAAEALEAKRKAAKEAGEALKITTENIDMYVEAAGDMIDQGYDMKDVQDQMRLSAEELELIYDSLYGNSIGDDVERNMLQAAAATDVATLANDRYMLSLQNLSLAGQAGQMPVLGGQSISGLYTEPMDDRWVPRIAPTPTSVNVYVTFENVTLTGDADIDRLVDEISRRLAGELDGVYTRV